MMTLEKFVALGLFIVVTCTVGGVLMYRRRKMCQRSAQTAAAIIGEDFRVARNRAWPGGFQVIGDLRGRPTTLVLDATNGLRRLSLDMICRGVGFFDVGPSDGPKSLAVQIADGAAREMTNRIVQQFCARVMLDVPSGSKNDQHLTITLPELPRDLTPPSNLRTISRNALDLCALLER
jgi:hypothetical protein